MLAELQMTTFTKCLDTEFQLVDENSPEFSLKLTDVIDRAKTPRQETFSLLFQGPAEHFVAQGIHKLEHDQLGVIDIFLVPIGQGAGGFQYEAVFNHQTPPV